MVVVVVVCVLGTELPACQHVTLRLGCEELSRKHKFSPDISFRQSSDKFSIVLFMQPQDPRPRTPTFGPAK